MGLRDRERCGLACSVLVAYVYVKGYYKPNPDKMTPNHKLYSPRVNRMVLIYPRTPVRNLLIPVLGSFLHIISRYPEQSETVAQISPKFKHLHPPARFGSQTILFTCKGGLACIIFLVGSPLGLGESSERLLMGNPKNSWIPPFDIPTQYVIFNLYFALHPKNQPPKTYGSFSLPEYFKMSHQDHEYPTPKPATCSRYNISRSPMGP